MHTASRPLTLTSLRREMRALAKPEHAKTSQWFFKTGPGQYGEGDRFLGLRLPTLRSLARKYRDLDYRDALKLLQKGLHEERLLALILLGEAYARAGDAEKNKIYRAYLANTRYINNWDLVDSSAEHIVGAHLWDENTDVLTRLARSKNLWKRRISIVATFYFIKRGKFGPTLEISELLLDDAHDLIHKATGWMLREVGKKDRGALDAFLMRHYRVMPRTMLRYAIERHPEKIRKAYLAGAI